jgi:hypothetical protein
MITDKRAHAIAAQWYDGDGSGLYTILCGHYDKMTAKQYAHAYSEALIESKRDSTTRGGKRALNALARFIDHKATRYGINVRAELERELEGR